MADAAHETPGEPPAIRDEAADSPPWLPALGLALLMLGVMFILWRGAQTDDAAAPADGAAEVEAPADAPAGDVPAEGAVPAAAAPAAAE